MARLNRDLRTKLLIILTIPTQIIYIIYMYREQNYPMPIINFIPEWRACIPTNDLVVISMICTLIKYGYT